MSKSILNVTCEAVLGKLGHNRNQGKREREQMIAWYFWYQGKRSHVSAAAGGDWCRWLQPPVELLVLIYSPSPQVTKRQQVLLIKLHQAPKYPFRGLVAQERKRKCGLEGNPTSKARRKRNKEASRKKCALLLFRLLSRSQMLLSFLKNPTDNQPQDAMLLQ